MRRAVPYLIRDTASSGYVTLAMQLAVRVEMITGPRVAARGDDLWVSVVGYYTISLCNFAVIRTAIITVAQ